MLPHSIHSVEAPRTVISSTQMETGNSLAFIRTHLALFGPAFRARQLSRRLLLMA